MGDVTAFIVGPVERKRVKKNKCLGPQMGKKECLEAACLPKEIQ